MFENPLPLVPYLTVPTLTYPEWVFGETLSETLTITNPATDPIIAATLSISPSGAGEMYPTAIVVTPTTVVATMTSGVAGRTYTAIITLTTQSGQTTVMLVSVYVSPVINSVWPPFDPPYWVAGSPVTWSLPSYLALNGIFLTPTNVCGWQTTPACLPPGGVWLNGPFISVVPGAVPNCSAPPLIYGQLTSRQLLGVGGADLSTVDPSVLNQLWLNGSFIAVSLG